MEVQLRDWRHCRHWTGLLRKWVRRLRKRMYRRTRRWLIVYHGIIAAIEQAKGSNYADTDIVFSPTSKTSSLDPNRSGSTSTSC